MFRPRPRDLLFVYCTFFGQSVNTNAITIQANRVTLTSSAVVEGEIHHRSLAIEENAWFAGVSRPEEASASEVTDPGSPIQHVPTDGNQQVNGSLVTEVHADTANG